VLVNKRLSAPYYRTQTLASNLAKSQTYLTNQSLSFAKQVSLGDKEGFHLYGTIQFHAAKEVCG
jgi:hypothetical protein